MSGNIRKRYISIKGLCEDKNDFRNLIEKYANDIVRSQNFNSTEQYIQHGTVSVKRHCLNVARYSVAISEFLPFSVSKRDLIRGALLHDYFLYDWHKDGNGNDHRKLHGFYHPGIALKNAGNEYNLTEREKDIIKKHMWPLTVIPPMCREAWIVTAADKYCSLLETLHIHKG